MEWWLVTIIMFVGLFALLLVTPVPVAYSLAIMGIIGTYFWWGSGGWASLSSVATNALGETANFILGPIPMYIFMAEIIVATDMSARAFRALEKLAGRIRGSLAHSTIVLTGIFGAISGFSPAATAAIGSVSIPQMLNRKYDKRLAVGVVGGGAALDILIPPSILMVYYGGLAEVSIGRLYIAGIVPGIVSMVLFMGWVAYQGFVNPAGVPRGTEVAQWKDKLSGLVELLPFAGLIFILLGTLYMGVATPSEGAAMGSVAAVILAAAYKVLNWKMMRSAILRTVEVNAMIFAIIFGSAMFTQVLVYVQAPALISQLVASLQVSRWVIMWAMQLLVVVMGCFMVPIAILAIVVPIFAPVIRALGFDPIVFGIMMMINMELATLTPPVGLNLFVLKSIVPKDSGITIVDIIRGVTPFIALHTLTMVLVAYIPALSLWLPSMMR